MHKQTPVKQVLFGRIQKQVWMGVFVVACVLSLIGLRNPVITDAATSDTVNFQARLLQANGAVVADGYYNVQFKLYDAATLGNNPWTETYYDSNGATAGNDNRVRVVNGYLTVNLGSQTAFPSIDWSQQLWLTMNIGGTTQTASPSWDGEMSPRLKLTAVPYAFAAAKLQQTTGANTSTLGFASQTASRSLLLPDESGTLCVQSSTNCGFAPTSGSGNYIQNGTSPQTANFNVTGAGTVGGQLSVGGLLQLATGTTASNGIAFGSDTSLYRSATNTLRTDSNIQVASLNSVKYLNTNNAQITVDTASLAQSPVSPLLWHDLLAFNKTATPTYQQYNGSTWNNATLDNGLFSQKEDRSTVIFNGTTTTGARWTWNSSGFAWSSPEWLVIGFNYNAVAADKTVTFESSADGNTWTTRHVSTTSMVQKPVWFRVNSTGGDTYLRLTITTSNGQQQAINSIRLLSSRWGDQGRGSEIQYPYTWDDNGRMSIGSGSGVYSNGVLNIGGSLPTTSSEGIYFGTDTNLYRSAADTLKTDDAFTATGNITAGGDINTNGVYKVNGTQISSANLSNDNNLAKLNASQTFSGTNTFSNTFTATGTALFKNASDSTDAFRIQNASGTTLFGIDTLNSTLTFGGATAFTGPNSFGNTTITGTTTPSYAAKTDTAISTTPQSVAVADIDNDGDLDVITANGTVNSISRFLNSGTGGTIGTKADYSTGANPVALAVGDINGDGRLDVVTANYGSSGAGNTVSVLTGSSILLGAFNSPSPYTVGAGPMDVKLVDVDNDGDLDIVTANYGNNGAGNTISVLRNNGDGTFAAKQDFTVGSGPIAIAVGDRNNDGWQDLLVANYGANGSGSTVSVLRNYYMNNPAINFTTDATVTVGTGPRSIAVGYLNSDKYTDIVTANYGNNGAGSTVSVVNTTSAFAFSAKVDYTTGAGPISVALGDANGDLLPDIYTANYGSGSGNTVSILPSLGTSGTYSSTRYDFTTGTGPNKIAIGDMNQDADTKPDIVTSNAGSQNVSVLLNNIDYAFKVNGSANITGSFLGQGQSIFRNSVDSAAAFLIQNAAGTKNLLTADTKNTRIAIGKSTASYTLDVAGDINTTGVYRVNGTQISTTNLSDGANILKSGTTNNYNATTTLNSTGTTTTGTVVQGAQTTGNVLNVSGDSLTSGSALSVSSTSSTLVSGNLVNISQNSTQSTTSSNSNTLLNVSRALTANLGIGAVATYSSYGNGTNSWTHVIPSYSSQILIVQVPGITTCTISSSLDPGATWTHAGNGFYWMPNPTIGTTTITVSGFSCTGVSSFSYTYYNVNLSSPFTSTNVSTGSVPSTTSYNPSVSLTTNITDTVLELTNTTMSYCGAQFYTHYSPGASRTKILDTATRSCSGEIRWGASTGQATSNTTTTVTSSYTSDITSNMTYKMYAVAIRAASVQSVNSTGSVASISDVCIIQTGGCNSSGNVLNLNQQYANATGAVLNIQNAGTGPDIQLGMGIIRPSTDSASAIRIQNATGSNTIFTVDTTNSRVAIGAGASAANGVLTIGTNTTAASGGIYFGTDTNLYRSGTSTLKTGGAFIATGTITTESGNLATTASTANLFNTTATTINIGGAATAINVGATTGTTTINNNVLSKGQVLFKNVADSADAFKVQNEAGDTLFGVDTLNNALIFGGASQFLGDNNFGKTTITAGTDPSFAPKDDTNTVDTGPQGVATADFNGDGIADIATVNYAASTVLSVRFGVGDGTYGTLASYSTGGAYSKGVAAGDINGDGYPDIVVTNTGSAGDGTTATVIFNNKFGGFAGTKVTLTTGVGPVGVLLVDISGDGKADVVTANYGNNGAGSTVSYFKYQSGTSFLNKVDYTVGSGPIALAAVDFENDNDQDILVANYGANGSGNTVSILKNDNVSGTLSSGGTLTTGTGPRSIVVGEVNGDMYRDVVTANYGNNGAGSTVSVITGASYSSFNTKTDYTVGSGPISVGLADFDGDLYSEIVTANYGASGAGNTVSVLKNDGTGAFPGTKFDFTTGSGPIGLVALDANNKKDSKPDIITANNGTNNISVLINNIDFAFTVNGSSNFKGGFLSQGQSIFKNASNGVSSFQIQDAAGTGVFNVDTVNQAINMGSVARYTLAYGTFTYKGEYALGSTSYKAGDGIVSADFNGDGNPDIAAIDKTATTFSFLLNNGDGTFTAHSTGYPISSQTTGIVAADFNGDSKPDVAVVSSSGLKVFTNTTSGGTLSFSIGSNLTGKQLKKVAAADFNGDSKPDIAATLLDGTAVAVIMNNGDGTFGTAGSIAAAPTYATGAGANAIVAADLTEDSIPDIATANATSKDISLLANTGTGTFSAASSKISGNNVDGDGLAVGDLNDDSKNDLIATKPTGLVSAILALGGSFALPVNYNLNVDTSSVALGDFDNDGTLDTAATYSSGVVVTLMNGGLGNIKAQINYPTVAGNLVIASADFNGDGMPDLASAKSSEKISILMANNSGTGFGGRLSIQTKSATQAGLIIAGSEGQSADYLHIQGSSGNNIFNVQGNGNVGIGMSYVASYKLDVNGDINTSGNYLINGAQITSSNLSDGSNLAKLNTANTFALTSSTALQIQNASAATLFVADTSTMKVVIGSGANTITLSGSTGISLSGTARKTKKFTLTPEYSGAVLDGTGIGTMTAGYDSVANKNYYKWTSTQGTDQFYSIVVRMRLPSDFSAWASTNPLSGDIWTDNVGNTGATVTVLDTAGATDGTFNNANVLPASANTWTTSTGSNFSGTYTADGMITLKLTFNAKSNAAVQVSEITFTYLSSF